VDLGYVPERSAEMLDIIVRLWPEIHCLRLTGSSSLGLAYVAAGRLSLYFHRYLYPWDTAAGLLMVREAGGEVTDFTGRQATCDDRQVIAANPGLGGAFREWLDRR
jgi:myo-inositol-1(or 4)-monophosphatase